jgi:hypothetical protein
LRLGAQIYVALRADSDPNAAIAILSDSTPAGCFPTFGKVQFALAHTPAAAV